MSQARHEQLVERYFGRLMSHAEEQEFFIQVAVDEELRRTMKAYGIIESAIRKEREAGALGHHAARENVATTYMAIMGERTGDTRVADSPEPVPLQLEKSSFPRALRLIAFACAAAGIITVVLIEEPWAGGNSPAAPTAPLPATRLAPDGHRAGPGGGAGFSAVERSGSSDAAARLQSQSAGMAPDTPRSTSRTPESPGTATLQAPDRGSASSEGRSAATFDTTASSHVAPSARATSPDPIPRSESTSDTVRLPVEIDWKIR